MKYEFSAAERALLNLQQGTYSAVGEKLAYTYYDTIDLAIATTTHRMFQVPTSGAKTLAETNMKAAGMMPQAHHHTVYNLKMMFTGNAVKDLAFIQSLYGTLEQTTVEFIIDGKANSGLWTLQELMGVAMGYVSTDLAAAAETSQNPSLARFHGIYPLDTEIPLAALASFEVVVTHHTAIAADLVDCKLKIGLNGELLRAS